MGGKIAWIKIVRLQRMITIVLIAVMLCCSFWGFYTVEFNDEYRNFYEPTELEDEAEMVREITITPVTSLYSVFHMFFIGGLKAYDLDNVYYDVLESEATLESDALGLAYLTIGSARRDMIVNLHYIMLILLSVLTPVFLAVILIKALVKYVRTTIYIKEHDVYLGVINLFRTVLCKVPFLLFVALIAPKVKLGKSLIALVVLCAIGVVVHAVASWFKEYTKPQQKYRSMIQIVSLLGVIVGAAAFALSCKSNLILRAVNSFFEGESLVEFIRHFEGGKFDVSDNLVPFLVGVTFIAAYICLCRPFCNNLCRISLTTVEIKWKNIKYFDARISQSIFPNFMSLIFFFLSGSKTNLAFYQEEYPYFYAFMGCVLFMTLIEILIAVLKAKLCLDVGEGGTTTVLDGSTYFSKTEAFEIEEISKKQ